MKLTRFLISQFFQATEGCFMYSGSVILLAREFVLQKYLLFYKAVYNMKNTFSEVKVFQVKPDK